MGSLASQENLKISEWFQFPGLWLEAQSYLIAGNNFYSQLKASAGQSADSSAGQCLWQGPYQRQPGPLREEVGGRILLTQWEKGRKSRRRASRVLKQGGRPPACFDLSGKCLTGCLPFP